MSLKYKLGIYIINKGPKAMDVRIRNELSTPEVRNNVSSSNGLDLLEGKTKNQLLKIILDMEKLCFGEGAGEEEEAKRIDGILKKGNDTEAVFLVQVFANEDIVDGGMATLQLANWEPPSRGKLKQFWVNEVCRGITKDNRTNIKEKYPGAKSPAPIVLNMLHEYLFNVRFPRAEVLAAEGAADLSKKLRKKPGVNLMVAHIRNNQGILEPNLRLQNYYEKIGYNVTDERQVLPGVPDHPFNFMRLDPPHRGGRRKNTRKHRRKNKRVTQSIKKKGGSYGELSESALKRMSSYARREKTRRAKLRKLRWSKGLTRRGKPRKRTKSKKLVI